MSGTKRRKNYFCRAPPLFWLYKYNQLVVWWALSRWSVQFGQFLDCCSSNHGAPRPQPFVKVGEVPPVPYGVGALAVWWELVTSDLCVVSHPTSNVVSSSSLVVLLLLLLVLRTSNAIRCITRVAEATTITWLITWLARRTDARGTHIRLAMVAPTRHPHGTVATAPAHHTYTHQQSGSRRHSVTELGIFSNEVS